MKNIKKISVLASLVFLPAVYAESPEVYAPLEMTVCPEGAAHAQYLTAPTDESYPEVDPLEMTVCPEGAAHTQYLTAPTDESYPEIDPLELENTDALCSDGIDNDANGVIDEKDPNCIALAQEQKQEARKAKREARRNAILEAGGFSSWEEFKAATKAERRAARKAARKILKQARG